MPNLPPADPWSFPHSVGADVQLGSGTLPPSTSPITLLPLRLETRFVEVVADPQTLLMKQAVGDAESVVTQILDALAAGTDLQELGDVLARRLRAVVGFRAQASTRREALSTPRAERVAAVREELEARETTLETTLAPMRRAHRSLGYRERYFDREVKKKLALHDPTTAETTRWTAGKKARLGEKLANLRHLDATPVSTDPVEVLATQTALIRTMTLINSAVYRASNIHAPEYEGIVAGREAVMRSATRLRGRLHVQTEDVARQLDVVRAVSAVKDLPAYMKRYGHRVREAAPTAWAALASLAETEAMEQRRSEQRSRLAQQWRDQLRARRNELDHVASDITAAMAGGLVAHSVAIQRLALGLGAPGRLHRPTQDSTELSVLLKVVAGSLNGWSSMLSAPGPDVTIAEYRETQQRVAQLLADLERHLSAQPTSRPAVLGALSGVPSSAALLRSDWHEGAAASVVKADAVVSEELSSTLDELRSTTRDAVTTASALATKAALEPSYAVPVSADLATRATDSAVEAEMEAAREVAADTSAAAGPVARLAGDSGGDARSASLLGGCDTELWIRVYPDDIALRRLEPDLSPAEVSSGATFWTHWAAAAGLPSERADRIAAWRGLVARHGTARARWVSRQTAPGVTPTTRPDGTQRPATALLPNRLVFRVSAYEKRETDGAQWLGAVPAATHTWSTPSDFVGAPIPSGLEVGLNLGSAPDPSGFGGTPGMLWMVDFATAVQNGMAVRVQFDPDDAAVLSGDYHFSVQVIGVRDVSVGDPVADMTDLLAQHEMTGLGFGLMPQGTPTNNTSSTTSGFSSAQPPAEQSFASEHEPSLPADADVERLALTLGVDRAGLTRIDHAERTDIRDASIVNRALFNGTLGQWLEDALYQDNEWVITEAILDETREFFTKYVRGRGSAPAIRVGRQPYGVLPMTNLFHNTWTSAKSDLATYATNLYALLRKVWAPQRPQDTRPVAGAWREVVDKAVRGVADPLGAQSPEQRFLSAVGLTASSLEIRHRYGLLIPDPVSDRSQDLAYMRFMTAVTTADPAVGEAGVFKYFEPEIYPWGGGCVVRVLGPLDQLDAYGGLTTGESILLNDLVWFRNHGVIERFVPADPTSLFSTLVDMGPGPVVSEALDSSGAAADDSLLYLLARKSLLAAYWDAAAKFWRRTGRTDHTGFAFARETFRIFHAGVADADPADLPDGDANTKLHYLEFFAQERPLGPPPWPPQTGQYLHGQSIAATPSEPEGPLLHAAREDIRALGGLSPEVLDACLREHLDTCTHRLDAWLSGLIQHRLEELREAGATNAIGAYGFVEDLLPGGTRTDAAGAPVTTTVSGQTSVATDPDNQGFVHAPSLAQAMTGAIVRAASAGHDGHAGRVNLSSQRARLASSVLEGIRHGQALPKLLGYLFERLLLEADPALGQHLPMLRREYPIMPHLAPAAAGIASDALGAQHVVDGLKLTRAWRSWTNGRPSTGFVDLDHGRDATLEILDGVLDAVGDLLLAEATFQTTRGNFDRAAAALKVISDGAVSPDLEVLGTPRRGFPLEHRVGICLHPDLPVSVPSARVMAEPSLAAWVARLLPLDGVRCAATITYDGGATSNLDLALIELGLAPVDILYMIGGDGLGPDGELARWLRAKALETVQWIMPAMPVTGDGEELDSRTTPSAHDFALANGNPQVRLHVRLRRPAWAPEVLTLQQLHPLALNLFRLITGARPMRAGDLARNVDVGQLDSASVAAQDVAELRTRAEAARLSYRIARDRLRGGDVTMADLRDAAKMGIAQAIPHDAESFSGDPRHIRGLADAVGRIMDQRLGESSRATEQLLPTTSDTVAIAAWTAAIRALLGKNFMVCPHFTAHSPVELQAAAANPPTIPDRSQGLERWLDGVARVREPLLALERTRMFGPLVDDDFDDAFTLSVLQLPRATDEPWLGLEYPKELVLSEEKLSLVLHLPPSFAPQSNPCLGLIFDAWTEDLAISEHEPTGLAYHYDEPNAEAPQALLVAVHSAPDVATQWSWDELFAVLDSAREMMRLRAVEPDQMVPKARPADPPSSLPATQESPLFFAAPFVFDRVPPTADEVSAGAFHELATDFAPASDKGA